MREWKCSLYGGDRILTEEYGDMEILSYHVDQGIVRARDIYHIGPRVVFKLPSGETKSDSDFFLRTICARWEILKAQYVNDDNFTDYFPAYYTTLKAMDEDRVQVVRNGFFCRYC